MIDLKKTVIKSIKSLIPADYNPRQLTHDQYEEIKTSIEKFGLVQPIVVNVNPERMNIIVGGHQRVIVARALGYADIPCIEVNLSPEDEREANVRLNHAQGEWDWDALANNFDNGKLLEWGFKLEDFGMGGDPEDEKEDKPEPISLTALDIVAMRMWLNTNSMESVEEKELEAALKRIVSQTTTAVVNVSFN